MKDKFFNILFVFCAIVILVFVVRGNYKESTSVNELKTKNDSLIGSIRQKSDTIAVLKATISTIQEKNDKLELADSLFKITEEATKARLIDIEANIANIPPDTIYHLLRDVTYPDDGEKVYPFSENQIKSILVTKIEHDTLGVLVDVLDSRIENLEGQIGNLHRLDIVSNRIILYQDSVITEYSSVVVNDSLIIDTLEGELLKGNKRLRLWKISAFSAIGIGVLLAL